MNGKISNFQEIASLRRYTFTEGRERGLSVIDCDNGKIRFLLNASKALDIMQVYHKGMNVSFLSKNAFTEREIPFGKRFEGGMVYTCGLDSAGGGRPDFEMHGTFHNLTPEITRAECGEDGITVEATIRDTALFGKNLVMKRKVFSAIGSDTLTLEDRLFNMGTKDEEYCLLYHTNVGYPMLDEGARIEADVVNVEARSEFAISTKDKMFDITADVPNQPEACFYLTFKEPKISVVNPKVNKRLTVSYSGDTLPYFVEWKSMGSGDYAIGLEPSTTSLGNKFKYTTLKVGESVRFFLSISVSDLS